ncbi:MAG TPA: KpsF/GutQ family sugar-phosphate isomerase [Thermodesulfobacteriaceae bacterium]|nr:KpsF/GutQ family sugar-phosphate isomerase [Thermodesulfobacteriaceae bacterium]
MQTLEIARRVLRTEIEGLEAVEKKLGASFEAAVELILSTRGRVVVIGLGKSGLIGRKISATFSSTGTPSFFLHPAEALHGDLGMVTRDDVLLALSNSGKTEEVNLIVSVLKRRGVKTIALTGNLTSPLARLSDVVIDVGVPREACPHDLAPTASTTATLAVGDALAVALAEARGFGPEDFRRNHPGGSLGERLKVRVAEIMLTGERLPLTREGTPLQEALPEMDRKRLGCILVLDPQRRLRGIITDGDLRRALVRHGKVEGLTVDEVMTRDPKKIEKDRLASEALDLMEKHLITVLPVVDAEGHLVGILHLHDILGKGSFKFTV